MQFIRVAAHLALATLAAHGPLPQDADDAMHWCWRELGIVADWKDALPGGADGSCYTLPREDLAGRIWVARSAPHPRYTIAHEVGHLLSDSGAAFSIACDAYQMLPEERAANAFAATFLIEDDALCDGFGAGWTLPQLALSLAVPQSAVLARLQLARLLGEVDPSRLDRALDGHWDGC